MSDLEKLRREVAAMVAAMSPWIMTPEMCARYDCCIKTLNRMERANEIPWRVKNRWSRAEVMAWENKQMAC